LVRRVSTIAVLLIVQGALDLALGLALAGVGLYVATGRTGLPVEMVPLEPRIAVVVFGPTLVAAGALKVAAGVHNYRFRKPVLGIVALASGLLSALNCYCAPFALGLTGYGLYVYRRPEVERAFLMGQQGLSREWIEASLAARPPR
jgi:hypothetical protein